MRGINYMAGLATLLIFASFYSFKAAFYKRAFKEEEEKPVDAVKNYGKVLLILFSLICLALGVLLIAKSLKII